MQVRNPKYNADGSIDVEIEHPIHGWIPFTASADDSEEHGRTIFAEAEAGDFGEVTPYPAPEPQPEPVEVPYSVTRFQAKAILRVYGLRDQVDAMMADPQTDPMTADAWEYAQEYRRDSVTVNALADALGLSSEQVDQMFIEAAEIDA